jgi:aerobic-type carbon monoxide dehydrogenase small subunit (CoxS/CutS family)
MPDTLSFKLNDKPVRLDVDPDRTLLWVLRTDLGLTGTKYGCGEGHCGCCTVLVDKSPVRACILKMKDVQNKNVLTIEGLALGGRLHPMQKAFMQHDALQCGFCTPGQIMQAVGMLNKNPHPTREEILRDMNHNFCRCGAYTRIVDAIQTAAAGEHKGGW